MSVCILYLRRTSLLSALLGFFLAMSAATSMAQSSSPTPQTVTLDEALAQAIRHSPQIKEEQFGTLIRQSQRAQADAARFAQFDITIVGGPSPQARGNQIDSPDSKSHPKLNGAFGQASFSLVQPLYTFGKIQSFRKAAAHGIAASEAMVHQKATEVALLVYEAYYGYQLATSLEDLGLYIGEQLQSTLQKVQRQLDAEAPGVDNIDLFKLQTFDGQLAKQMNDVRQGKELALTGLRTLMGLPPDTPITLADTELRPDKRRADALEAYVRDAHQLRPEFTQAREGVQAFAALVNAAKADYYPVFFLGVFGSLAEASNRDRVNNPFIFDSIHDDVVVPVIGLRWHYDLGLTTGKVREAQARLGQVQQKHALAEMGIPFQVRQAHLELVQHENNIEATRKGFRSSRKWLVAALSNFDFGVGEGKDVADAVLAYATLRAGYFQAVYNYNLALVKLDHAAGRDVALVQPLLPDAAR
jgi:outer membrane protein TolC